jgi:hypothetical protein
VQDRELYAQILGVREPWRVESVELKLSEGEVHEHLAHEPGLEWLCPECGKSCAFYDHQPERRWRHLDKSSGCSKQFGSREFAWSHFPYVRRIQGHWYRFSDQPGF